MTQEDDSNSFHLRITGEHAKLKTIVNAYIEKFKPTKYAFGFEKSANGVEHVHGYLEYQDIPSKQNISNFFKPLLEKRVKGGEAKYYHKECRETDERNLQYCTKSGDVPITNLTKEQLDEVKNKNKEIEEDKKLDQRNKLYNEFVTHIKKIDEKITKLYQNYEENDKTIKIIQRQVHRLSYIANFINDLYVFKYFKEPPVLHMRGYVLYIATRIDLPNINYRGKVSAYWEEQFREAPLMEEVDLEDLDNL